MKNYDKLLPCPFCGGEAVKKHQKGMSRSKIGCGSRWYRGWVECVDCGAQSSISKTPDSVIKKWNKRTNKEDIK